MLYVFLVLCGFVTRRKLVIFWIDVGVLGFFLYLIMRNRIWLVVVVVSHQCPHVFDWNSSKLKFACRNLKTGRPWLCFLDVWPYFLCRSSDLWPVTDKQNHLIFSYDPPFSRGNKVRRVRVCFVRTSVFSALCYNQFVYVFALLSFDKSISIGTLTLWGPVVHFWTTYFSVKKMFALH
jgi:hypothetical protein